MGFCTIISSINESISLTLCFFPLMKGESEVRTQTFTHDRILIQIKKIHFAVRQKLTQHCKAIILKIKIYIYIYIERERERESACPLSVRTHRASHQANEIKVRLQNIYPQAGCFNVPKDSCPDALLM